MVELTLEGFDLSLKDSTTKKKVKETKTNLPGIPKNLRIDNPPGVKPNEGLANQLKHLLEREDWITTIKKVDDEHSVLVKPEIDKTIKRSPDGTYYDTRIAEFKEGKIVLKPDSQYSDQIINKPGYIYRGIYKEEMDEIKESGVIATRGDVVGNFERERGLTFYYDADKGDAAAGAADYAKGQRMPASYSPSFSQPNYVIRVKKPDSKPDYSSGMQNAYSAPIKKEEIAEIYEVRPITITEGEIPLSHGDGWIGPSTDMELLTRNAPRIKVVFKSIESK